MIPGVNYPFATRLSIRRSPHAVRRFKFITAVYAAFRKVDDKLTHLGREGYRIKETEMCFPGVEGGS